MKTPVEISSTFHEYIDFHQAVFDKIYLSQEKFIAIFCPKKTKDYVIKLNGQPFAFYIKKQLIKASPYISSAPVDYGDDEKPNILWPVFLEKNYILPFSASLARKNFDYSSLSNFDVSDELFKKMTRLISNHLNDIFRDINDDLWKPAAISGMKCVQKLINAGREESDILQIKEDFSSAFFFKEILNCVIYNDRLLKITHHDEDEN